MTVPAALLLCGLAAQGLAADEAPLRSRATVKDEISGAKQDLNKLKRDIAAGQQQVRKQAQAEASIVRRLSDLERSLDKSRGDARTFGRNLGIVEDRLRAVRSRSTQLQGEEAGLRRRMAGRLVAIYKAGPLRPAALLFSSRSAAELISRWRFLRDLARDDQRRLGESARALAQNEEYGREYKKREQELARSRRDVEQARAQVEREQRLRKSVLNQVRAKKSRAMEVLAEQKRNAGELQGLMDRLRREVIKSAATGTGERPSAPSSGARSSLRGRHSLAWPVAGRLLSRFGEQKHPQFNTRIFNRGIEIAGTLGAEVRAVADGVVKYAEYFEGFGQMVILDHGGGMLSVYGRNSAVEVARDEHVQAGRKIAEVGDAGSPGGPSLYFEIRKEAKPLNPLDYLKRR